MLRKLDLKSSYSSELDDLYQDFFAPALTVSVAYKRAVGFFSLGVLLNAPAAMTQLVANGGKIELIFGKLVAPEDFDAIRRGLAEPWASGELPDFRTIIDERRGSLVEYRIRVLAWLFANEQLEMKVAIRPKGMFHQKIGILTDKIGDAISFSGSMNETTYALDPQFNSEEISVFRAWSDGQQEYVRNHQDCFERLWSGDTGSSTTICGVPQAIREGLNFVADSFADQPKSAEEAQRVKSFFELREQKTHRKPSIPETMHGKSFVVREHQLKALRAWTKNAYNGILELATGAGKTITAIYAAVKIITENAGMVLIVAVPYQDLADQWCEELSLFGIDALRCYGARGKWEPQLQSYLRRNRGEQKEFLAIVVVNKTLKSDRFQSLAEQLDKTRLIFIGDECHHHGGKGFVGKLLPDTRFRIGLSATPFHYLDEEANDRLGAVYDRSVFKYTLADAVREGVLTPYEYHPIPVELTDVEAQDYLDLSDQIARLFASGKNDMSGPSGERLKALLMRRARLIGAAENKIPALEALLDKQKVQSHSLFYCSDGKTSVDDDEADSEAVEDAVEIKQRYAVAQVLMRRGVRVAPFTSDENRWQRREILKQFKSGETQALVAIRCLDEGIDVPACQSAYLLASSRNPRQFVQRRGRILRRAEGKDRATIYDFVVVMPQGRISSDTAASDFLRNELGRVADFASNSLYPASSVDALKPWLVQYGLDHMAG